MHTVVHAVVIFFVAWLVIRVVGKREISQLSAFDFVILVVMGDLIAEGVISEDTSLTGAVIAVATIALLTVIMSWLSWRLPRARAVFEGLPTLLVQNGTVLDEAMRTERLTLADLHEAARVNGVRDVSRIRWAVLEQDGNFSFFEDD